jgi:hypothetical protein
MARTPKVLRTAKKAGAATMRVAGKLDDVKRGGKPPRPATVSRYKNERSKNITKILRGGTVPEREARGEKGVRAKSLAESKGMVGQMRKDSAANAKKSVVASGFNAKKPAAKKPTTPPKKDSKAYMAEKRASSRATAKNKGKY